MSDSDQNQIKASYQVEMRSRFGIHIGGRGEIEYESEAVRHFIDQDHKLRLSHPVLCIGLGPVDS